MPETKCWTRRSLQKRNGRMGSSGDRRLWLPRHDSLVLVSDAEVSPAQS